MSSTSPSRAAFLRNGANISHSLVAERRGDSARPDRSSRSATAAAARRAGRRAPSTDAAPPIEKQAAVSRLIQVYSLRGHQIADLDPLGLVGAAGACRAELRFPRARRVRPAARVLDGRIGRHGPYAHEAPGHPGAAEANLLRQARRRVRAHLARARAALAARAVRSVPRALGVRAAKSRPRSSTA